MTNTLKPIQWIERTALNRSRKLQNSYTRIQQTSMKFYDVGVNLTDGQFKGVYHGRSHHQSDLEAVIDRASKVGVTDFLVTASNKSEVTECIELCKRYRSDKLSLYCTGGVHPCSVTQIKSADNPALYLQELKEVISEGKRQGVIKAFGEIGLDFDRFHFAPRDLQEKYFIEQLSIAADPDIDLPLFLHSRSCHQAFCDILYPMIDAGKFPRRILGTYGVEPKVRKILQLLRLLQINNGTFVRVNKATVNMLIRVAPYVTWGSPSVKTVRDLIYKRGFARINNQRIPITNNILVQTSLGKYNIQCVEDVVHEIFTVGNRFKQVNSWLSVFKLNTPTGGWNQKKINFIEGGDAGFRGDAINALLARMI